MPNELSGRRVAFLIANEGAEQAELTTPWQAVKDAGGTPELLAPQAGQAQAFNHLDKAGTFPVDRAAGDADANNYDALRRGRRSDRRALWPFRAGYRALRGNGARVRALSV